MMSDLSWPYLWLRPKSTDFIEDSEVKIQACLFLYLFCFWLDVRLKSLLLGRAEGSCERGQDMVPRKSLASFLPLLRVLPHGTSSVLLLLYQMSDCFQKPRGDETHPWASPRLHLPLWSLCSELKQGRQRVCLMVCLLKRDLLRVCVHKCMDTCALIHVETRGQTWMSLRSHSPYF